MKKLLLLAFLIPCLTLSAQSNKEEIEMYQAIFGMEKKEITSKLVSLTEENQESFWAIYDEYETERKAIGQKRIDLLNKYAQTYSDIDDENVTELVKGAMDIRAQNDKLIKTYYNKIYKGVGHIAAAQFYQLEHYFLSEINVAIYSQVPMVGELKVD
jgi:methanogenic corrinoid protein MtbC1